MFQSFKMKLSSTIEQVEMKLDIQGVITVVSCIFIEVISNVEPSVVVRSILEINQVQSL